MKKLEGEKRKAVFAFSPTQAEMSPSQREEQQKQMISTFKQNVNKLKTNLESDTKDDAEIMHDKKYKNIIVSSFVGAKSVSHEDDESTNFLASNSNFKRAAFKPANAQQ